MVDYAKEYGIDRDTLMTESFGHPIAQWENERIHEKGVEFWDWYRRTHPVAPAASEEPVRKVRRPKQYSFTDEQIAIAMRSVRESR